MITPFPVESFGGLRLDADPDEVGISNAIDILNVDFDKRGAIRTRDGYNNWVSTLNTRRLVGHQVGGAGGVNVLCGAGLGGNVSIFNSVGIETSTTTLGGSTYMDFTSFGTPTANYIIAVGSGGLKRTTLPGATTWTNITGPFGTAIAVQPQDNRVVIGNTTVNGSFITDPSRVYFSAAGDATTWSTSDFVDLDPGDDETIMAIVPWRELLFVFKQSKFYVFTGNDTSGGITTFNYRTVDTGCGCIHLHAACAGPDGVFFVARDGVYVTTGGTPTPLSNAIAPYFKGETPYAFLRSALGAPDAGFRINCAYVARALYVSLPETTSCLIWKYDLDLQAWSVWAPNTTNRIFTGGLTSFIKNVNHTDTEILYIGSGTAILRMDGVNPYTDGSDGQITSRYRSGFYTVGNPPSQETVIRETIIDGSSQAATPPGLKFSLARDYGSVPTTGGGAKSTVTLGSSFGQGRHTAAQRGRRFSYQIEDFGNAGNPSVWRVESLTHHVVSSRPAGLKTAA